MGISESRPMSFIERFATCWGSPVMHFTLGGRFTEALIREAMLKVRRRNPLLRCTVENENFIVSDASECDSINLPVTIHEFRGTAADRFAAAERLAWRELGFNMVPRNLWRMTFHYDGSGCDMVFLFHHSILDGMSCFSIMEDFLNACKGMELKPRAMSVPMETVLPRHAKAVEGKRPDINADWLKITDFEPVKQPIYTHCAAVKIPPAVFAEIRNECRLRSVTFHGALMAASLFATDNELPKIYTDVSTRRWCNPQLEPSYPGIYLGQIVWAAKAQKDLPFWQNAQRLQLELQEHIINGEHLAPNADCVITATGPESFNITNMHSSIAPGGFSMNSAAGAFAVSITPEVPRFPIVLVVVSVNDACILNLCYHRNFWTRARAVDVLSEMVRMLSERGAGLAPQKIEVLVQPEK